jgi:LacI family transcriptional regulator
MNPTRNRSQRRSTIHDLAREAGVSKTTVSRVLNGSPDVAAETRSRVLAAIDALGFQVNLAARALRTSRSGLIGLLVPVLNEVFSEIASQLDRELSAHGFNLLIATSNWETDRDLLTLEALHSRGVDALVISLADDRNPEIGAYLRSLDRPIVLLDREVRGVVSDSVLTDQRGGVTQAVEHLAGLGHRSIGLITMSPRTRPGREAYANYAAACAAWNLRCDPELTIQSDHFDPRAGRSGVDRLVSAGADAIMALGPMGLVTGVLERLGESNLRIPDDISVISYDENPLAFVKPPRLTVIARPIGEIGRLASQLVTTRLANLEASPRVEVVQTRLIVRDSTGLVKREVGKHARKEATYG